MHRYKSTHRLKEKEQGGRNMSKKRKLEKNATTLRGRKLARKTNRQTLTNKQTNRRRT